MAKPQKSSRCAHTAMPPALSTNFWIRTQCRPPDNDVEQPCEDHESHQDGPSSPNEWADRAGGGLNLVDRVLLRHFYCTIVLAHDTERVVGNARVRVVVAPVTEHAQPRLLKLVSLRAGLSGCPVETSDGVAVVPQPRLRDRAPGAAHPDGVVGPAPGHAAVLQQLPHKRHQRGVLARRLRLSQVIVTAPPPCLFRAQSEAQKLIYSKPRPSSPSLRGLRGGGHGLAADCFAHDAKRG
mmetsp:Transcript_144659/g.449131  ORF Transcript_144659/g.449131 Transcript_144659/m.449131 type:complete len:238 (+) Transcript_144659:286-999(+)